MLMIFFWKAICYMFFHESSKLRTDIEIITSFKRQCHSILFFFQDLFGMPKE